MFAKKVTDLTRKCQSAYGFASKSYKLQVLKVSARKPQEIFTLRVLAHLNIKFRAEFGTWDPTWIETEVNVCEIKWLVYTYLCIFAVLHLSLRNFSKGISIKFGGESNQGQILVPL